MTLRMFGDKALSLLREIKTNPDDDSNRLILRTGLRQME